MSVKSSELQVGDIVLNHGMRIRIDEVNEIEDASTYGGRFHCNPGTVLNVQEAVEVYDIPRSFLYNEARHSSLGASHPDAREDYWVTQGNDLATWTIESREEA